MIFIFYKIQQAIDKSTNWQIDKLTNRQISKLFFVFKKKFVPLPKF